MEKIETNNGDRKEHAEFGQVNPTIVGENLISGVRWLRFADPLERLFEAETGRRRSRHLAIGMIPALIMFEMLVFMDYTALPDIVWPATILRLGVMNVVGFMAMWVLWKNPRPVVREGLAVLVLVAQGAILGALVAMSHSVFRGHYHVGMLLGLMFGVMVLRVRFWYMLLASVMTFAIFVVTSVYYSGIHEIEQSGMMSVMFAATVFSMIAGYSMEREERLNWLRSLNERMRSDRFEEMSNIDPLTGLGNRRALDAAVADLRAQGKAGDSVALAIADIDYFKAYNDAYGHVAGDDCLRRVAGMLTGEARKHGDRVFRFGGEEFVILLASVDFGMAEQTCERMRQTVEAAAIPQIRPERKGRVTLSFGVAVAFLDDRFDTEALIFAADTALYTAKSHGRNRVSSLSNPSVKGRRRVS